MNITRIFVILVSAVTIPLCSRADTFEDQVELLFRPSAALQSALSDDGAYVAFTRPRLGALEIVVVGSENGKVVSTLLADEARVVLHSKESEAGHLRYLGWSASGRLVFAPGIEVLPPPPFPSPNGGSMPSPGGPILIGDIFSVGARGEDPKKVLDSGDLALRMDRSFESFDSSRPTPIRYRTADILGFRRGSQNELLVEVQGFKSGSAIHFTELIGVDVASGKQKVLSEDLPFLSYVYDQSGARRIAVPSNGENEDILVRPSGESAKWVPAYKLLPATAREQLQTRVRNYFGERVVPLGFGADPGILFVASNVGQDTFTIFAADIAKKTMEATDFVAPGPDLAVGESRDAHGCLVFDKHTGDVSGFRLSSGPRPILWRDDELRSFERTVAERFPDKTIEILEWSKDRTHFLLKVSDAANPGTTYLFIRRDRKLLQLAENAPWLTSDVVHKTIPIELGTRDGARVSGYLTLPNRPLVAVPPIVVVFSSGFPGQPHREFEPEAHVLAGMGFMVARINQRGTSGFGRSHLQSRPGASDTLAVGDVLSTLDWLSKRHKFDHKRVVALGRGYGGHLALRALQIAPGAFRCAVAFDAPVSLNTWLPPDIAASVSRGARRALLEYGVGDVVAASVLESSKALTKPVFLVVSEGENQAVAGANLTLHGKLRSLGRTVELAKVHEDFALGLPKARATLYSKLREFLMANVYDFDVRVGPVKEVEAAAEAR